MTLLFVPDSTDFGVVLRGAAGKQFATTLVHVAADQPASINITGSLGSSFRVAAGQHPTETDYSTDIESVLGLARWPAATEDITRIACTLLFQPPVATTEGNKTATVTVTAGDDSAVLFLKGTAGGIAPPLPDSEVLPGTAFPNYLVLTHDYQINSQPQPMRTQMEDGLAKQASRYSLTPIERQLSYRLLPARLADFKDWLKTHQSSWFAWQPPESAELLQCRIRDGAVRIVPEFDQSTDTKPARYSIHFVLESWG